MNKPPNQWRDDPIEAAVVETPQSRPPRSGGSDAAVRMIVPVDRSVWAIAAGYLGLISVIPFFAPLAVIASVMAIIKIQKSRSTPRPVYGMGRAIFGLLMGGVFSIVLVLILLAVVTG